MNARVVEFNSLSDAIGPGPEDDDLVAISGSNFCLLVVGRVVIRGLRSELCRAGVDCLVDGAHTERMPKITHFRLI